jgi:hypothetical protein
MPEFSDGLGWLIVVNLLLWSGLFLYILRLQRSLRAAERAADETAQGSDPEVMQ